MIPFGDYAPDQADFENTGSPSLLNVIPRTKKSFGPFPSLASVTNALDARCQGAFAARDDAGNVFTFAGDAAKLYLSTSGSFGDASKPGGYATVSDGAWRFVQYGKYLIGTNYQDDIQVFEIGTSTNFADLSATAPKAKSIAVIKNHVMVGNTNDTVDGPRPNRVWHPAIDDPTDWPTIGTSDAASKQSDFQDLAEGVAVQNIIGGIGGADGAIFLEKAIYRVAYEGPPTIFGYYLVERDRGTPAPDSVVNVGKFAFYLGEDGFYVFNGQDSQPIGGQRVDKTFFADLDQNYFHRIYGAADPINKVVYWVYPGSGNVDGQPNKCLIYNWDVNRWSPAEFDCQLIFRDLTLGYTLEGLDALGYTMDNLPFSLDSRAWTGGRLILSAFNTAGQLARFSGAALQASLETAEFGGSSRIFVSGIRPYVDGGTVTAKLRYRDTMNGVLQETSENAVDPDGMIHFTQSARFIRAQINIAAGGDWEHAQGLDADFEDDGEL